jgi:cobalt/nickel transport system permease protein
MPEWLAKTEEYTVNAGRDTFIDKSILALFGVIARLRLGGAERVSKTDAAFRVFFTLALIVATALAREFSSVFVALTFVTLQLAALPPCALRGTVKFAVLATLFAFIIVLPAAFAGNRYSVTVLPAKVFVSAAAVNILSRAYGWDAITGALARFRVPDIFVFLLDITVKYIFTLGEFTLQSLQSLKLRCVGRTDRRYGSLAGVAGVLFLRSKSLAEETQQAMECRGFSGQYPRPSRLKFRSADALYSAANIAVIAVIIWIEVTVK